MRLLLIATLLLFTTGCIRDYETHSAHETCDEPQQRQWSAGALTLAEGTISGKESDPYNPRHDFLYRLYLGATVLGVLGGIVGVGIIFWQVMLLRQSVDASAEQSRAMERHIGEAARSANAMEEIADKIEAGNKAVMRAYLTVNIGGGSYQETNRVGQIDVKFGVSPTVANTGNTPARRVRIRTKAALFPSILPDNFSYDDLGPETETPYATVAAHQSYTIHALLDDVVPDADVARIKVGDGQHLHAWGTITYEDIFGDLHTTKFGQWIVFIPPNNQVLGWYTPGQNDAD
jgi:hypothetical protein